MPLGLSSWARRTSSLKIVLPPSMIVSPGVIRPASSPIVSSVILPAGSITQTVRGLSPAL